jgi:hypothetical protein
MSAPCVRCGKTWTGIRACHCAAPGCHRTFGSVTYFDRHRSLAGEHGRCIDPATIDGLFFRDGMWKGPEMDDEAKAKAFKAPAPPAEPETLLDLLPAAGEP